ncbi:MAG TPA: hypothetical protein VFI95_00960 [Terriglobales bacterium]|nr:hypothetical protein [Terriglobales bacterium]
MFRIHNIAALLLTLVLGAGVGLAAENSGDRIGKPLYTTRGIAALAAAGTKVPSNRVLTIPYWTGSFKSNSSNHKVDAFSYTMAGNSPWATSPNSVVPTTIVPLSISFSNGMRLDGSTKVQSTIASPIFQPFQSQTGFTQYGDAVYRASFFKILTGINPNWHVLLGQPTVMPTEYLTVPADSGFAFNGSHSGAAIGLVDSDWFNGQLKNLISKLKIDPRSLTIFLTENTFLFLGNPGKCCIVGFHSGVLAPEHQSVNLNTFVWASYSDAKIFDAPIQDITALSHEIAEWYSDPFLSNTVKPWAQPGSSVCSANILEVGDPLQGFHNLSFTVMLDGTVYHPQDAVLFSWFARQKPSIGFQGRYSYRGDKLFTPAPPCFDAAKR